MRRLHWLSQRARPPIHEAHPPSLREFGDNTVVKGVNTRGGVAPESETIENDKTCRDHTRLLVADRA